MSTAIDRFFDKFSVKPECIKTLTRDGGKTFINMLDGRSVETYFSVKAILDELSKDKFVTVNKGVVIALNQIEKVEGTTYYLIDGTTVTGRKRRSARQTQFINFINESIVDETPEAFSPRQFKVLDNMPSPFFVIEVVFTENGKGMDFVLRYCNREMAEVSGMYVNEMIDHSFLEIFPNADKKRLVTYSDVALNGNAYCLNDYLPQFEKQIKINCFQPNEGYCACMIQSV